MKRICLTAVCAAVLYSCLALPPQRARDLYLSPAYRKTIGNYRLVLDSVTVEKGYDSRHLQENAAYIFHLLLVRRNLALADPEATLALRALIKERELNHDFKIINTVTVELTILNPPSTDPVALVLFTENTDHSVESYAYLHSLIRSALRQLPR